MITKFGTKSRNFKLLVRLISEICRKKEPLGDNRPRLVFKGLRQKFLISPGYELKLLAKTELRGPRATGFQYHCKLLL